jgi:isopenicillin N synthase-like dioxygenase
MEIPIIDLAPFFKGDPGDRKRVARLWGKAFETIGFATIVGHRVPLGLMERLQSEAAAFFNLPIEEKMRCTFSGEQRAQGYVPMGVETVARTMDRGKKPAPPDLCESMTFPFIYWEEQGKITNEFDRSVYKPNFWPEAPAGLHAVIREYSSHVHQLALSLMHLSAWRSIFRSSTSLPSSTA